jgi:aspartate 1-decarboxylase
MWTNLTLTLTGGDQIAMLIEMCKCKLHRATITEANLEYEGSLTVDRDLMDAAGLLTYEKVSVVNINTGSRLDTYVIEGGRGTGVLCLNGAAARLGARGDRVIIIAYASMTPEEAADFKPSMVYVDEDNKVTGVGPA